MFKQEIQAHGAKASGGVEGGASVRGRKGAVMLYGNYDVSDRIIDHDGDASLTDLTSNTMRFRGMYSATTIHDCSRSRRNMIRRTCSISCLLFNLMLLLHDPLEFLADIDIEFGSLSFLLAMHWGLSTFTTR